MPAQSIGASPSRIPCGVSTPDRFTEGTLTARVGRCALTSDRGPPYVQTRCFCTRSTRSILWLGVSRFALDHGSGLATRHDRSHTATMVRTAVVAVSTVAMCYAKFAGLGPIREFIRNISVSEAECVIKSDSDQLRAPSPLPASIPVYALSAMLKSAAPSRSSCLSVRGGVDWRRWCLISTQPLT